MSIHLDKILDSKSRLVHNVPSLSSIVHSFLLDGKSIPKQSQTWFYIIFDLYAFKASIHNLVIIWQIHSKPEWSQLLGWTLLSNMQLTHHSADKYYQNLLAYLMDSDLSSGYHYPPFEQLGPETCYLKFLRTFWGQKASGVQLLNCTPLVLKRWSFNMLLM